MPLRDIELPAISSAGTTSPTSMQSVQPDGFEAEPQPSTHQSKAKFVPSGSGPAYWGPGTLLTFLITGKDTGGAFFLAEMSIPPGGGPPPHVHSREDESFHVLEGSLTVRVGEDTLIASAGDFAFLPRGIAHSFKNTGATTVRALVLVTPAGLENYFAEVFDLAEAGKSIPAPPGQELIARALAASSRYGLELMPPA
jgi:quercetin dioxygenase-like cupin family protein